MLFTEVLARAAGHPYSCTVMKQGESCCSRSGIRSSAVLPGKRSAVWLQSSIGSAFTGGLALRVKFPRGKLRLFSTAPFRDHLLRERTSQVRGYRTLKT